MELKIYIFVQTQAQCKEIVRMKKKMFNSKINSSFVVFLEYVSLASSIEMNLLFFRMFGEMLLRIQQRKTEKFFHIIFFPIERIGS